MGIDVKSVSGAKIFLLDPRPGVLDTLGLIPSFLSLDDARPAREQFDAHYAHGGGWRPFEGFNRDGTTLTYHSDPPLRPLARIQFRQEQIFIYRHGWVMILQNDGSYEVCRMD